MPEFDVVGVGLNATDTLLLLPHFPAYAGKVPFTQEILSPGGQVASAMVACARLGLRTKYIGTVGDDERGRIQMESLLSSGINLDHVQQRTQLPEPERLHPGRPEHRRADRAVAPAGLPAHRPCTRSRPNRSPAPACCTSTGTTRRRWRTPRAIARQAGIPVTVDVDTIYHGFDKVLPNVDYLVTSSEFPARWTSESDPFKALELIQKEYGMRVAAMTLGAHGALASCRRAVRLFACLRGELRRYDRSRRRVSRGLLLCCPEEPADARRP